jgi:hypothetical protein
VRWHQRWSKQAIGIIITLILTMEIYTHRKYCQLFCARKVSGLVNSSCNYPCNILVCPIIYNVRNICIITTNKSFRSLLTYIYIYIYIYILLLKRSYFPLKIEKEYITFPLHWIQVIFKFGFRRWACERWKPCKRKSSKYCLNTLPSRLLHPACFFLLQLFNSLDMKINKLVHIT